MESAGCTPDRKARELLQTALMALEKGHFIKIENVMILEFIIISGILGTFLKLRLILVSSPSFPPVRIDSFSFCWLFSSFPGVTLVWFAVSASLPLYDMYSQLMDISMAPWIFSEAAISGY
ncbi:hypothetical protein LguiA_024282 [Lonicera macranthoides]